MAFLKVLRVDRFDKKIATNNLGYAIHFAMIMPTEIPILGNH
jgi:hypothetical protein